MSACRERSANPAAESAGVESPPEAAGTDLDASSDEVAETMAPWPGSVAGTFDETLSACEEPLTFSRLHVAQDTLTFYYGYATIDSVSPRDGGYDAVATLYELEGVVEVVPTSITYRVEPQDEGDGLLFGALSTGRPLQALVRCSET